MGNWHISNNRIIDGSLYLRLNRFRKFPFGYSQKDIPIIIFFIVVAKNIWYKKAISYIETSKCILIVLTF